MSIKWGSKVIFLYHMATASLHLANIFSSIVTKRRLGIFFKFRALKKWCLEKEIAKEIENYKQTRLDTLLERFHAEIKNKHGYTSQTTILFHRKWFKHRLNNSLNCLAQLWIFLRLKDVKILLYIMFWSYAVVLTERTMSLAGFE